MTQDSKPIRLGELLIDAEIIKADELTEAIKVASDTGLPIGRVLIMSGYATEQQLQAGVQAQSLIKDKLLELALALTALKKVTAEGIGLDHSLKALGWSAGRSVSTAKLGELLLAAELISSTQLDEALRTSQETGLPLGRVLVLTQAVSDELLSAALTAQVLVRDGKITKDHAIQGLKSAKRRRTPIEVSLMEHGFYRPPVRQSVKLGELFTLSGLVDESDLMNSLEVGLTTERPIGQVLVESGLITADVLAAALKLQEMVINNTLNSIQAAEAVKQISLRNISLAQAVAEVSSNPEDVGDSAHLGDILKAAGFLTDEDIRKAVTMSMKNSALIGKMLLVTGFIDEALLHAALRSQYLLRHNFLSLEQTIVVLNHCQTKKVSLDDALQQLGWTTNTRIQLAHEIEPPQKQAAAEAESEIVQHFQRTDTSGNS